MQRAADLALSVRAGDYDRFLAIQLAPAAKRPALYAVTAFSVELSKIAETVSEAMIGQIKLAWWREALEEIINGKMARPHPVVLALAEVYPQQPAVFAHLLKMVEARAADLDESLLASEEGWLNYLDGTAGALHRAWALILDAESAATHDTNIQSAARAYAMIGLVRAIPYMASQGFIRFPEYLMQEHELKNLAPCDTIKALVLDISNIVKNIQNQNDMAAVSLLPLRCLSRFTKLHLKNLEKLNYDPYAMTPKPLAMLGQVLRLLFIK